MGKVVTRTITYPPCPYELQRRVGNLNQKVHDLQCQLIEAENTMRRIADANKKKKAHKLALKWINKRGDK